MYTILGVIAEPLGWLLSFLYGFIKNYNYYFYDYCKNVSLSIIYKADKVYGQNVRGTA